jgi:DNA-binding XRE family transcriptional regulator
MTTMNVETTIRPPEEVYDPLTMALAILMQRIRNLPRDDQNDLFELAKALPDAQPGEEYDSIGRAMREILDQAPSGVRSFDQTEAEPVSALKNWTDFVSEKIRSRRTHAGLTQAELAKKTGLPQSHISRLETGAHSPSRVTLAKIAAALECPLSEFDPSAE